MFLTLINHAKPKTKFVSVLTKSIVSGHKRMVRRERLGEKKEMIHFDPYVQQLCLYKEVKKVKSIRTKLRELPEDIYKLEFDEETGELKPFKRSHHKLTTI